MRINHNIPALRTLHQMNRTNSKIDKTMQRLSSGLRINSASDDAAGLAIAQKMDTQVRGLQQANRNAMDGISLIQTAEGALNEVHSMLQRVRELSIQASNGTLTPTDRKAITDEVAQLKEEIDRISEHIEYNEKKLLNGDIDRRAFSSDRDIANVVSMSDGVMPGDYEFRVTAEAKQAVLKGGAVEDANAFPIEKDSILNINGEQVELKEGDSAETVFGKIRDLCGTVGIDLSVDDGGDPANVFGAGGKLVLTSREYGVKQDIKIKGDTTLMGQLGLDAPSDPGEDVKIADIVINNPAGKGFPLGTTPTITNGNTISFDGTNGFKLTVETQGKLGVVKLSLLETGPLDLQIGANEGQMMQLRIPNMSTAALGLTDMSLKTAAKSQEAITLADAAIAQVSSTRSKLGAYQNRLEHTVANLDVAAENMTASMSRIQDADMAQEMATYTKDNILAQAGNAMLAQANQRPQQILQLLQ